MINIIYPPTWRSTPSNILKALRKQIIQKIVNGIENEFKLNSKYKELNLIFFINNDGSIRTSNKAIIKINKNFVNPLRFFLSSYKPIIKTTDGKIIHVKMSGIVFVCIIIVWTSVIFIKNIKIK